MNAAFRNPLQSHNHSWQQSLPPTKTTKKSTLPLKRNKRQPLTDTTNHNVFRERAFVAKPELEDLWTIRPANPILDDDDELLLLPPNNKKENVQLYWDEQPKLRDGYYQISFP